MNGVLSNVSQVRVVLLNTLKFQRLWARQECRSRSALKNKRISNSKNLLEIR